MPLIDPESAVLSTLKKLNENQEKLRQLYEFMDERQRLHIDTIDRDVRQLIKDTLGIDLYNCIDEIRVELANVISEGETDLAFLDGDIQRLQNLIRLSQNEDILLAAYNWQLDIQDAHNLLDSFKVPRTNPLGTNYTIAGRIWTLNQEGHKIPSSLTPE